MRKALIILLAVSVFVLSFSMPELYAFTGAEWLPPGEDSDESTNPDKSTDGGFWMAKSLSMKIIAEDVEEREQVELLKRLRCDFIQGYIFVKPMLVGVFG